MENMCLKQRVLYYIIILMLVMVLIVLPVSAFDVVVGCEINEFCNGQCVNLQTDQYNCGSCGNSCIGSQVCQNGHCSANIVLGSVLCFLPFHNCNDQCVDLQTDMTNCGDCGTTCTYGQTCVNGACNSPPNLMFCTS